jgi:hypothetical protein
MEVDTPDGGRTLPVLQEKEPNNWPEQAPTVTPGMLIRGHIGYPLTGELGDRDVYCFDLSGEKPRMMRAELRGVPRLTMQLTVRSSKWALVRTTKGPGPGKGLLIPNLSLAPGKYCLVVSEAGTAPPFRFNRVDPYELTFSLSDENPGEEREPNESLWSATTLEPGTEIRGLIGDSEDLDWYRIPLTGIPAGSLISVSYGGVAGVTVEVSVYDHNRKEVTTRRGVRGAPVILRDLRLNLQQGVMYVLVAGRGRFNTEERYRLKVEPTSQATNREVEPNDTQHQAVPLSGPRGEVRGSIEVENDVDWYELPLPGQVNLRLHLIPPPGLDLQLSVRDSRGKKIASADEGRAGEPELLSNVRAVAAVRIKVSGARGSFDPKRSYRLLWAVNAADRGDERELNDTLATANWILPGVSARGFIHPVKDVDFYQFRLIGGLGSTQRVRISVQGLPGVRLKLTLLDDQQAILSEAALPTSEGMREIETTLHCSKTYYLKLQDEHDRRANPGDSYELTVALVRR